MAFSRRGNEKLHGLEGASSLDWGWCTYASSSPFERTKFPTIIQGLGIGFEFGFELGFGLGWAYTRLLQINTRVYVY